MARTPPGKTRERVYQFVRERLLAGHPPTVREVQQALGFAAVQSAQSQLTALVEEGRLLKEEGSRGYRLAEKGPRFTSSGLSSWVPLLGRVAAGPLTPASEDIEGYLAAPPGGSAGVFALRVRGESMLGAGILPGDLVLVRRQAQAQSGEIVVALVGEEATVKRLRLRPPQVELWAENPAFAPLRLAADEVQLLGKVIEVRRHLEPLVLPTGMD